MLRNTPTPKLPRLCVAIWTDLILVERTCALTVPSRSLSLEIVRSVIAETTEDMVVAAMAVAVATEVATSAAVAMEMTVVEATETTAVEDMVAAMVAVAAMVKIVVEDMVRTAVEVMEMTAAEDTTDTEMSAVVVTIALAMNALLATMIALRTYYESFFYSFLWEGRNTDLILPFCLFIYLCI